MRNCPRHVDVRLTTINQSSRNNLRTDVPLTLKIPKNVDRWLAHEAIDFVKDYFGYRVSILRHFLTFLSSWHSRVVTLWDSTIFTEFDALCYPLVAVSRSSSSDWMVPRTTLTDSCSGIRWDPQKKKSLLSELLSSINESVESIMMTRRRIGFNTVTMILTSLVTFLDVFQFERRDRSSRYGGRLLDTYTLQKWKIVVVYYSIMQYSTSQ